MGGLVFRVRCCVVARGNDTNVVCDVGATFKAGVMRSTDWLVACGGCGGHADGLGGVVLVGMLVGMLGEERGGCGCRKWGPAGPVRMLAMYARVVVLL